MARGTLQPSPAAASAALIAISLTTGLGQQVNHPGLGEQDDGRGIDNPAFSHV
jgi:hypothetical protein